MRLAGGLVCLAAALAGVSSSVQAVEITVGFRFDTEAHHEYWEHLTAEFEATHPDIEVTSFSLVWPWIEKITTMMASGESPDVIEMWGDFAFDWANTGALLDVTPYVERDFSADDIADFFPGQWDASLMHTGENAGIRYGIPRYTNVQMQMYNIDLLNQAGLEMPIALYERGEWTWDALRAAAQKLTRRSADGSVSQWGYKPRIEGRWPTWVWGNGGKVFDWPENPTDFMIDQPAALEALEYLRSLVHDYQVAPVEQWGPDFESGLFGIGDGWGSCCFVNVDQAVMEQFAWNVVPIPAGPEARRSLIFIDLWGIWSGTQHPDAAWKFVRFATSTRGMEIFTTYLKGQPSRRSALPAYLDALPGLDVQYALESAATAWPDPYSVVPEAAAVVDILEPAVASIVYQNRSPSIVVEEVKPAVEALYR